MIEIQKLCFRQARLCFHNELASASLERTGELKQLLKTKFLLILTQKFKLGEKLKADDY